MHNVDHIGVHALTGSLHASHDAIIGPVRKAGDAITRLSGAGQSSRCLTSADYLCLVLRGAQPRAGLHPLLPEHQLIRFGATAFIYHLAEVLTGFNAIRELQLPLLEEIDDHRLDHCKDLVDRLTGLHPSPFAGEMSDLLKIITRRLLSGSPSRRPQGQSGCQNHRPLNQCLHLSVSSMTQDGTGGTRQYGALQRTPQAPPAARPSAPPITAPVTARLLSAYAGKVTKLKDNTAMRLAHQPVFDIPIPP